MSAEKTNNGAAAGRIPVTEEKRLLRSRMKALRAAAPDRAERDKRIFENLFAYPAFAGAQSVFIYCSLAEEAGYPPHHRRTSRARQTGIPAAHGGEGNDRRAL